MLGTNDLKARFQSPASEIAMGMGALVSDIKEMRPGIDNTVPEIVVVSPPPILEDLKAWKDMFAGGRDKSLLLAEEYERIAEQHEVHFFDAGSVVSSCPDDGFHLDLAGHQALGQAMVEVIEGIGWA